jgi:hypothetical protein
MKSRMLQKTTLMSHHAALSSTSNPSFNACVRYRRNINHAYDIFEMISFATFLVFLSNYTRFRSELPHPPGRLLDG